MKWREERKCKEHEGTEKENKRAKVENNEKEDERFKRKRLLLFLNDSMRENL